MARLDRYLLSQLLAIFGFFALVLVLIYWINRALRLFDRLIADGQSALVFLELTALSLPGIIRIVLPLAGFVAALYVTNRASADAELTVMRATGFSPWRLARPFLFFGLFVGVLMSVLGHLLVPMSLERLTQRNAQIAQNLTAKLLTPGEFLTPTEGVTFFISQITQNGEMHDIFISETNGTSRTLTYTAAQAYLVRAENGPQLVMIDGLVQRHDRATNRIVTTRFDDLAYDVGALIREPDLSRISSAFLPTSSLLNPTPLLSTQTGNTAAQLISRGHDRFGQALFAVLAPLIAFSAMIIGNFSRFGMWRNILLAVLIVVLVKMIEGFGISLAEENENYWLLTYTASLIAAPLIALLLAFATRPAHAGNFFSGRQKGARS